MESLLQLAFSFRFVRTPVRNFGKMANQETKYREEDQGKKERNWLFCLLALSIILLALPVGYFIYKSYTIEHLEIPSKLMNKPFIVERSVWGAEAPVLEELINLPTRNIIIGNTVTEECQTKETCVILVKSLQDLHMKTRRWDDIGYNFLVGADGEIYEGTGWTVKARRLRAYGAESISIGFIGNFTNQQPLERQTKSALRLIEKGVLLRHLHPDYHIFAERQLEATESPGLKLFELIKSWPQWSMDLEYLRYP